jgi:hypothetical protein
MAAGLGVRVPMLHMIVWVVPSIRATTSRTESSVAGRESLKEWAFCAFRDRTGNVDLVFAPFSATSL